MPTILDGKALAQKIKDELKEKISALDSKPGLGVILVGEDPASQVYVSNKVKACEYVGMKSKKITAPSDITELDLLKLVNELNDDTEISGFIVQVPLPDHINEQFIIDSILPHKDADGFCPINLGNMLNGNNTLLPATPKGIMRLLEETGISLEGKHAVVIGRSNTVGKPISLLLQQKNTTVTMCHSKTANLSSHTKNADVLIVAAGKPKLITKDHVKEGAIVIDVGIHRQDDGSLCGDVDFDSVSSIASHITPVPGGVGPMTVAMLLENALECYETAKKLS